MCVVSMVTDHYTDKWRPKPIGPYEAPYPFYPNGPFIPRQETPEEQQQRLKDLENQIQRAFAPKVKPITDEEINEFRQLMERAREYDKRNSEPHCEDGEKIVQLKRVLNDLKVSDEQYETIMRIVKPG